MPLATVYTSLMTGFSYTSTDCLAKAALLPHKLKSSGLEQIVSTQGFYHPDTAHLFQWFTATCLNKSGYQHAERRRFPITHTQTETAAL